MAFDGTGSERPAVAAAPPRITLKAHPAADQRQLADEIARTTALEIWPDFVTDYGMLRRAVCAAEGWRQPACRAIKRSEGLN